MSVFTMWSRYTGNTQKNGAVLIVFIIKTAPFFCVCPVRIQSALHSVPLPVESYRKVTAPFILSNGSVEKISSSRRVYSAKLRLYSNPECLQCIRVDEGTRDICRDHSYRWYLPYFSLKLSTVMILV
jgi:hypothetical protein